MLCLVSEDYQKTVSAWVVLSGSSTLDNQDSQLNLSHDWLMSLAMNLVVLCHNLYEGENATNGCYLAIFMMT